MHPAFAPLNYIILCQTMDAAGNFWNGVMPSFFLQWLNRFPHWGFLNTQWVPHSVPSVVQEPHGAKAIRTYLGEEHVPLVHWTSTWVGRILSLHQSSLSWQQLDLLRLKRLHQEEAKHKILRGAKGLEELPEHADQVACDVEPPLLASRPEGTPMSMHEPESISMLESEYMPMSKPMYPPMSSPEPKLGQFLFPGLSTCLSQKFEWSFPVLCISPQVPPEGILLRCSRVARLGGRVTSPHF